MSGCEIDDSVEAIDKRVLEHWPYMSDLDHRRRVIELAMRRYRNSLAVARAELLAQCLTPFERAGAFEQMGQAAVQEGCSLWIEEQRLTDRRVDMVKVHDRALFATSLFAIERRRA